MMSAIIFKDKKQLKKKIKIKKLKRMKSKNYNLINLIYHLQM